MIKKIFKTTFWLLLLCASIWVGLYVAQTASNPFATREKNIERVNTALIQQYEKRKEAFSALLANRRGYQQNDTIRILR